MAPTSNSNGTAALWKVLGILVTIAALAIAGIATATISHASRISSCETKDEAIIPRLDRMEDKIDELLRKGPK